MKNSPVIIIALLAGLSAGVGVMLIVGVIVKIGASRSGDVVTQKPSAGDKQGALKLPVKPAIPASPPTLDTSPKVKKVTTSELRRNGWRIKDGQWSKEVSTSGEVTLIDLDDIVDNPRIGELRVVSVNGTSVHQLDQMSAERKPKHGEVTFDRFTRQLRYRFYKSGYTFDSTAGHLEKIQVAVANGLEDDVQDTTQFLDVAIVLVVKRPAVVSLVANYTTGVRFQPHQLHLAGLKIVSIEQKKLIGSKVDVSTLGSFTVNSDDSLTFRPAEPGDGSEDQLFSFVVEATAPDHDEPVSVRVVLRSKAVPFAQEITKFLDGLESGHPLFGSYKILHLPSLNGSQSATPLVLGTYPSELESTVSLSLERALSGTETSYEWKRDAAKKTWTLSLATIEKTYRPVAEFQLSNGRLLFQWKKGQLTEDQIGLGLRRSTMFSFLKVEIGGQCRYIRFPPHQVAAKDFRLDLFETPAEGTKIVTKLPSCSKLTQLSDYSIIFNEHSNPFVSHSSSSSYSSSRRLYLRIDESKPQLLRLLDADKDPLQSSTLASYKRLSTWKGTTFKLQCAVAGPLKPLGAVKSQGVLFAVISDSYN